MIKQQRILIIALLAVFAVLLAAYFIVVRPLTAEEETTDAPVETEPDEGVAYDTELLMFPKIERSDMQSIEVHNEHGTYKFVYDSEFGDFELEGHENLAFDATLFSRLVVNTGFTLAIEKITNKATEQELLDYGFKGDAPYYTLTTRGGKSYTVRIGEKIISGGGYYAMVDGREAIYILDASLEMTVLAAVEEMVSPILTAGVEVTSYFKIDNFTIKHYGEDFLQCRNRSEEELGEMETTALAESLAVYPAEYSLSTHYDDTLQMLCNYEGEAVAAIGLTDENLEKFGLTDKPYSIHYEFDGFKFDLVASEPVDGYYYVSTSIFDVIIKVPEADFSFLKYDLLYWVSPRAFSRNITFVSSIKIESDEVTETFNLSHHPNDDPNLVVIGDECGQITDIPNFRELYKDLLLVTIEDYAPEGVEPNEDNCVLKFTVTTKGGSVTEYAFYRYSTRRCLLTINGKGQFYVLMDMAQKIMSDTSKVIAGQKINATDKS